MDSKDVISSEISNILTTLKSIVFIVKHTNINFDLPDGYALIQEIGT